MTKQKSFNNLWKESLKVIPGGNGLLSKRPQRFLPKGWPIYFKKSKGINIWDLNGKKYADFSVMGIGTSIAGYSNSYINNYVKKAIDNGVNTTLNCIEEQILAKKILKIDKFADQVKFSRSGGEAMALAVRIARSKSRKSKVLFSGYHGWHDWYLAANISNKNNLNNHLLKDLVPLGVPSNLKSSVIPFEFNNLRQLKELIKLNKDVGTVVVECARSDVLNKKIVKYLNSLKKKNICLIVDEITTGWRTSSGGIYKDINLSPDLVVYGKAIGNGFAISCVVGKKKYMKLANKTFVSSTAWTERVGFSAGISTIDFYKKHKVFNHIKKYGKKIVSDWSKILTKHKIKFRINKYLGSPSFQLEYGKNSEIINTRFTEIMLNYGYLATNYIFLSFMHKENDINRYLKFFDKSIQLISEEIKNKKIKLKSPSRRMLY